MIKKLSALVVILILLILPKNVFAADEFATSYNVVYDIDESGLTNVTEKVTLRNLTSQYYANQFKLTIGATQISDIKASDEGGALNVTTEQKDSTTTLGVNFNQQIAGLGKKLPWTISFKSKDFAEKIGKIWEVRAPRIATSTNLESYDLTLSVPLSFGEPSSISPAPKSQTVSSGKLFLTFDKSQLLTSGIFATFGVNQLFDFDLSYHLENNNLVPILTNIALPPDTNFQDVIYQRIDPKPLNVTVDDDGNYLAWFRLNRGQKLDIKVFGSAKLYTNSKVRNPVLEDSLRRKYIQSDKYWEKDNPQIVNKLNEIFADKAPADSEEKAKIIFQFVVDYLKYDSGRLKDKNIERLGAVTALNNPDSAVCMEFTDLFIALARADGIPSRELDGYAYTANPQLRPLSLTKDVLHSWPEYWNEKRGWVMVDPTWENTTGGVDYFTKLDLNHFTFVVKGLSSEQPVPAGSYKYNGQDSHDVKVVLSETDFLGKPQIDVSIDTPYQIYSGFPGTIKVKVANSGNSIYSSTTLAVTAGKLSILDGESRKLGVIPPFGISEFDFNIRTKSLFESYNDQISVLIGGQRFTKDISVKPFLIFRPIPLMIGGGLLLIIIIFSVVLGIRAYQKRNKKKVSRKS